MGCLCQASTGCNLTIPCTSGHQYLCGPFLISWAYWADAGKFVLSNDNPDRKGGKDCAHLFMTLTSPPFQNDLLTLKLNVAFEACVQDPVCAGETVRGYMVKFAQVRKLHNVFKLSITNRMIAKLLVTLFRTAMETRLLTATTLLISTFWEDSDATRQ